MADQLPGPPLAGRIAPANPTQAPLPGRKRREFFFLGGGPGTSNIIPGDEVITDGGAFITTDDGTYVITG